MGRRVSYRKGLSVAAFLYAYYGRSVSFRFLIAVRVYLSVMVLFFKHCRSVSIRLYFPTAPVFNPCRRASHMERASRANVFLIHTLDCVCRMSSKSMWNEYLQTNITLCEGIVFLFLFFLRATRVLSVRRVASRASQQLVLFSTVADSSTGHSSIAVISTDSSCCSIMY